MGISVRDYLQGQVNAKLADASSIADLAEKEARDMTPVEKTECKALLDDVTKLKGQIAEMDEREELRKSIDAVRGPVTTTVEESLEGLSLGEAFTKSEGYRAVVTAGMRGKWSTGVVELPGFGGAKALGSGQKTLVAEAASAIVVPDYQPGIMPIPTWPLRVLDLFPQGNTTANSVVYAYETTATNNAAATSEGTVAATTAATGLKPESAIVFTTATEAVQKIATFLPVSDEMLEDVAAIQSYLNNRLSLFVRQTEETQLLSGDGTAPNISGVMDRAIQTSSALALDTDSIIDAIAKAMTAVRVTGLLEPDGIVMHPTDWDAIRLMKDKNNQYYGGGPFTGAYGVGGFGIPQSLWGLPVVVTTSIATGTILVGAFRTGAQVFRRSGLTVEASNSHDDWFQKNLTAIRAETRLALAVYRPTAFYAITGASALEGS